MTIGAVKIAPLMANAAPVRRDYFNLPDSIFQSTRLNRSRCLSLAGVDS